MLPKPQRLNLKKDFKFVASGKRLDTKLLKLFVRTGDNKWPRVGIALSSKHFKNATDRNRAKRLVSFAFESIYVELPANINIVALPKPGILIVKSKYVVLDLEEALKAQGLI